MPARLPRFLRAHAAAGPSPRGGRQGWCADVHASLSSRLDSHRRSGADRMVRCCCPVSHTSEISPFRWCSRLDGDGCGELGAARAAGCSCAPASSSTLHSCGRAALDAAAAAAAAVLRLSRGCAPDGGCHPHPLLLSLRVYSLPRSRSSLTGTWSAAYSRCCGTIVDVLQRQHLVGVHGALTVDMVQIMPMLCVQRFDMAGSLARRCSIGCLALDREPNGCPWWFLVGDVV